MLAGTLFFSAEEYHRNRLKKEWIDNGLQIDPGNPELNYALVLWYVRQKIS
jgi:hypothetical protein